MPATTSTTQTLLNLNAAHCIEWRRHYLRAVQIGTEADPQRYLSCTDAPEQALHREHLVETCKVAALRVLQKRTGTLQTKALRLVALQELEALESALQAHPLGREALRPGSAVGFFVQNAAWGYRPGYETPLEGHLRGAAALAEAEDQAELAGWELRIRGDEEEPGLWSAYLVDSATDEVLQGLHGIDTEPGSDYYRVIRAELALEQLKG